VSDKKSEVLGPIVLASIVDLQLRAGHPEAAIELLERAGQDVPEADRHALRAEIALASGDDEAAARSLDAALALEAAHPRALLLSARLAERGGDLAAALNLFDAAIAAGAGTEAAYAAVDAIENSATTPPNGVDERWTAMLQSFPHESRPPFELAKRMLDRGEDFETALVLAKRSVRFGSGAPGIEIMARLQLGLGNNKDAIAVLERSVETMQQPASTYYWLGMAYEADGDVDAARSAYRKAATARGIDVEQTGTDVEVLRARARPSDVAAKGTL
jgi:tetratricopeptide (TPR) repeat protein